MKRIWQWRNKKSILWSIVIIVSMQSSSCCLVTSSIAHHSFLVPPIRKTPADVGLPCKEVAVSYGNKTFIGWLVTADASADSVRNAVLIFNGIGAGLSSWVHVQRILFEKNITSLVFNYSDLKDTVDYRHNTSSTSFDEMEHVIPQFFSQLVASMPKNTRFFLLGHSLGCAVVTQHFSLLDTAKIEAVILCSPFSSLRESASHHGYLPRMFLFIIPEKTFSNLHYVPTIHKPLLLVHSKADSVNLYRW